VADGGDRGLDNARAPTAAVGVVETLLDVSTWPGKDPGEDSGSGSGLNFAGVNGARGGIGLIDEAPGLNGVAVAVAAPAVAFVRARRARVAAEGTYGFKGVKGVNVGSGVNEGSDEENCKGRCTPLAALAVACAPYRSGSACGLPVDFMPFDDCEGGGTLILYSHHC
jgi:hypothetical protein